MSCWEFKPRKKMTEEDIEEMMARAKSIGLLPSQVRKAETPKAKFVVVDYIALMK